MKGLVTALILAPVLWAVCKLAPLGVIVPFLALFGAAACWEFHRLLAEEGARPLATIGALACLALAWSFSGLPPSVEPTAVLAALTIAVFIHGQILPNNGIDVELHPIAFAAWFGLLVTAFNLLPVGQLDGGHVLFTLIGDKIRYVGTLFVIAVLAMGIALWDGWFVWAILIFLLGVGHPPPLNDVSPLNATRKLLALVAILIFILVFVPVPLTIVPLNGL